MALFSLAARGPFVFSVNPKPLPFSSTLSPTTQIPSFALLPLLPTTSRQLKFPSFRLKLSASGGTPDPISGGGDSDAEKPSASFAKIADEWGQEYEPEPEAADSKLPDSDPPRDEDEWEEGGADGEFIDEGNGSPSVTVKAGTEEVDDKLDGLRRALVDTIYGTELGIRAGSEVRAEVSELVTQLEAANPTSAPVEEPGLLNGNWVLLYTASSELLPLLAAGTTPLLKVDKIAQTIDTGNFTIVNSATLSSPFAYFSFSATASFEVRSPTRVQVFFKEGTLQPPEIKSRIELPENLDIFGQKLSLSPVQQSLGPLQDVVASISRVISGQPPLKLPIPGERTSSWLITTYLDPDLRISRGDGGSLFILAREGSRLLDQ